MVTWQHRAWITGLGAVLAAALAGGCADVTPDDGGPTQQTASALTFQDHVNICNQDVRVQAGLVTSTICVGADIFFRETFNGNGRTCGTCHPADNNFTIDIPFVTNLHTTSPNDPLFVFQTNPALANLETPDLLGAAGILENVDGFQDPTHRFVVRSVPHLFSLATSIARDVGDGTTNPPADRTGWGGDGAPGDGTLRSFLTGAVTQHYPKTLARVPGVDFRVPTSQELDAVNAFQLSLGRKNELDLTQVRIFDPDAEIGRQAFLDPQRGRCNVCHLNAGANFLDTAKNRNFDTGVRLAQSPFQTFGTVDGVRMADGGFGGANLAHPNIDGDNSGVNNAFGNRTFSPPPLIEAADTGPFFHNNASLNFIDNAVFFYLTTPFQLSQAAADLQARFGTPIQFNTTDAVDIARFLRVLNAAFNLDIAEQRLNAAQTLVNLFHNNKGVDVQKGLMQLAESEINDALNKDFGDVGLLPVAQDRLNLAKSEIDAGLQSTDPSQRQNHISNALSRVMNARDLLGSNINFQLGQGDLMF
jgi:cytochrome c peroxidase